MITAELMLLLMCYAAYISVCVYMCVVLKTSNLDARRVLLVVFLTTCLLRLHKKLGSNKIN